MERKTIMSIAGASLVAILGATEYVHNKIEEKRKEEERALAHDWEEYYKASCIGRTSYVSFTEEPLRFCTGEKGDQIEEEIILQIAKGDGSYYNDAGSPRPARQYGSASISNVPKYLAEDSIAIYAGIPTNRNVVSVRPFTLEEGKMYKELRYERKLGYIEIEPCYVTRNGSFRIGKRTLPAVFLEGQMRYCVSDDNCDIRYGAIVFVQKTDDFCKNMSTFQEHILNSSDELSLEDWKKNNPWR